MITETQWEEDTFNHYGGAWQFKHEGEFKYYNDLPEEAQNYVDESIDLDGDDGR